MLAYRILEEQTPPEFRCHTDFTVAPVRRRIHGIQTFNVLRGGEYFFMPGLSASKWLGDAGD